MNISSDIQQLAERFDAPPVQAIALMGSYARGEAGPHSDVDLVRFLTDEAALVPGRGSHIINERLVVVSDVPPTGGRGDL
jgi:predicted nucleotidyltransferase